MGSRSTMRVRSRTPRALAWASAQRPVCRGDGGVEQWIEPELGDEVIDDRERPEASDLKS